MKTYTQNRLRYHTLRALASERIGDFMVYVRSVSAGSLAGAVNDIYIFTKGVIDYEETQLRRFLVWLDKETEQPFVNWRTVGLLSVAAVVLLPIWFVLLVFS